MLKILFSIFLLTACSESSVSSVDDLVFQLTGGTLFSDPITVNSKDIHLDSGHLIGQGVVYKGEIVNLGGYQTHFVLGDSLGRMIIVLTNINDEKIKKLEVGQKLKVLGVVERKSKGYPYINASALNY